MKRFFAISLVVVFVVVLMAVPAFATDYFSYSRIDGVTGTVKQLPTGTYTGRILTDVYAADIYEEWFDLEPFELNGWTEGLDYGFDGLAYFTVDDQRYCVQISFYSDHDDLCVEVLCVEGEPEESSVYAIELVPYEPEPVSAEELTDSFGSFFSGVVDWFDPLIQLLQKPLVLLIVACVPLGGVAIWGLTKLKDS